MADVWLARFSRWLEKSFNAKGGTLLFDISPSIQAVVSTQPDVEDLHIQSVYRYAAFEASPAVAASQSFVQLRNPAGSNVVATVELVAAGPAVATVSTYHLSIAPLTADGSSPQRGIRLDGRNPLQSTCIMSVGAGASSDLGAPGGVILLVSGNNNNSMIPFNAFGLKLTILPGDALRVVDLTNNEAFTAEWLWRERALETSELT